MKKTILKAMLFFAFLAIVQNASAQYVTSDDATIILNTEVQSIQDNPAYANATSKSDVNYQYLNNKVEFFSFVNTQIGTGSTVETAIQEGVMMLNTTTSMTSGSFVTAKAGKTPSLTPLHQEILGLLSL